ncbi:OmpA family protein [Sphingorhabdus sp. Alg239-R122]|uniref:OmpA family protein n=1 Tax=Sphingorhabdus sp. Alg239-R122 TaxID=2305989 RepID=UPI0013DC537B|nr:OmpA family protein [Sphingorhabdus sp. Alg239-R122]
MRKLVIGLALASTAFTAPANARDDAWYVGVDGGATIVEDMDLDIGGISDAASLDHKVGYDFGGYVGYDFGGFRLETEVSWREADPDSLTSTVRIPTGNSGIGPTGIFPGVAGDSNVLSFMLNGMLDFGDDDGVQGFVGGGAGVARVNVDNIAQTPAGGPWLDDSDTGFAWQALAGVRAPLSDSWDVGLKYRFFNADKINLVDRIGRDVDTRFRSHSILGSLIYNFGGTPDPVPVAPPPPPPPVVAPPPPPPPPAPVATPCATGPYIVFFDFDQSNITPEAATILDNAVSAYANTSCRNVPIMLAGHTDTSGSASYNVGLSQRRNESVRAYLESRNVPAAAISSEAFGETKLRVDTADGVRELQNRRVEITYGPGSGM